MSVHEELCGRALEVALELALQRAHHILRAVHEHHVRRREGRDKLGGLRIVRVRGEGDVVDGEVDGHAVAGGGGDLLWLGHDVVGERACDTEQPGVSRSG
jgi:hypothetical protein